VNSFNYKSFTSFTSQASKQAQLRSSSEAKDLFNLYQTNFDRYLNIKMAIDIPKSILFPLVAAVRSKTLFASSGVENDKRSDSSESGRFRASSSPDSKAP
jgi:hypothetical protein